MKDEIKEILEFKEDADYKRLSVDEILILKDYITNLQEIDDKALTDLVHESHKRIELENKITNLQEENERLKKQCKEWKENHKAVCIQRDNILDNIVKDTEERIDYKSRNEKAYNYLDKFIPNEYGVLLTERQWEYVKKILGGDDNAINSK